MDIWQARKFHPEAFALQMEIQGANKVAAYEKKQGATDRQKAAAAARQIAGAEMVAIDAWAEGTQAIATLKDARDRDAPKKEIDGLTKARDRAMRAADVARKKADSLRSTEDVAASKRHADPEKVLNDAANKIADYYNDAVAGVGAYEGIEDLLQIAVDKGMPPELLVTRDGKARCRPSIFALHWLSWVANFDAAVGHHSLDSVQAMDEQGLSSRPQDRSTTTPTAEDRLLALGRTQVQQGGNKARDFLSIYRRGSVHPNELQKKVWKVPTELVPGVTFRDSFGEWLRGQPESVRAAFTEEGSRKLEPVLRNLAAAHGLAVSINEEFGGFEGHGNATSHATLVPLDDAMPQDAQERAVAAFAADAAWGTRQDALAYGRVAMRYPKDESERASIHTAFDFQLTRKPTPEEVERIAAEVRKNMLTPEETAAGHEDPAQDTGFSLLPNNTLRFVDFNRAFRGSDYMNRVARGIRAADTGGKLHSTGPGGVWEIKLCPYSGGFIEHNWEKDASGQTYTNIRDIASEGDAIYGRGVGGNVAGRLADSLRRQFEDHCRQFYEAHAGGQAQKAQKSLTDQEDEGEPPGIPVWLADLLDRHSVELLW